MAAKGQEALLAWCQQSVTGCVGVDVKDFHPKTWANGLAFCAIINKYNASAVKFQGRTPMNKQQNLRDAFAAAEKLGIPPIIEVDDLLSAGAARKKKDNKENIENVEGLIIQYVSSYYHHFAPKGRVKGGRQNSSQLRFNKSLRDARRASTSLSSNENCAACSKPLSGETVSAVGRQFHRACFKCADCGKALTGRCMNVKGKPHCKDCGQKSFSARSKVGGALGGMLMGGMMGGGPPPSLLAKRAAASNGGGGVGGNDTAASAPRSNPPVASKGSTKFVAGDGNSATTLRARARGPSNRRAPSRVGNRTLKRAGGSALSSSRAGGSALAASTSFSDAQKRRDEEAERKAKQLEEQKKKDQEAKRVREAEEVAKKKREEEEQQRKKEDEAKRVEEERKQKEEERKRKEEERKRREEEKKKEEEEERKRLAEEKRREEAENQRRKEKQERQRKEEEERKRREEEERKREEEEERKRREEAEKKRKEEAERKRKEEEERKRREAEEEKKRKEEAKRLSKEEAERREREYAAKKKKEEQERKRKEEEEKKRKEDEEKKRREEAEERKRALAEKRRKEEEERQRRAEEEKKREEEERKEREAERKRKEEAEKKRKEEAEKKRKEEAEKKRKEEAEKKRKEEEATRKREAEERRKEEEEKRKKEQEKKRGQENSPTDSAQSILLVKQEQESKRKSQTYLIREKMRAQREEMERQDEEHQRIEKEESKRSADAEEIKPEPGKKLTLLQRRRLQEETKRKEEEARKRKIEEESERLAKTAQSMKAPSSGKKPLPPPPSSAAQDSSSAVGQWQKRKEEHLQKKEFSANTANKNAEKDGLPRQGSRKKKDPRRMSVRDRFSLVEQEEEAKRQAEIERIRQRLAMLDDTQEEITHLKRESMAPKEKIEYVHPSQVCLSEEPEREEGNSSITEDMEGEVASDAVHSTPTEADYEDLPVEEEIITYNYEDYMMNNHLEGYLMAKASNSKLFKGRWKPLWFSLQDQNLIYYQQRQTNVLARERPPDDIIFLRTAEIFPFKSEGQNVFRINTPDVKYLLQANSPEEMEVWVENLNAAKEYFNNAPQFWDNETTPVKTADQVECSGWLEKLGRFKQWQKRYFVLRGGVLYRYKQMAEELIGKTPLYGCEFSEYQPQKMPNCFEIRTRVGKTIVLRAIHMEEMHQWLNSMIKQKVMIEEEINSIVL